MKVLEYTVIIEREGDSFGAYLPDLPGCVAMGRSLNDVRTRILEAVEAHVAEMLSRGEPLPRPGSGEPLEGAPIIELGTVEVDIDCLLRKRRHPGYKETAAS